MIVRNYDVGRMIVLRQSSKRGAAGGPDYDAAAPASDQPTHPLQHKRIVVDHDDKLAVGCVESASACKLLRLDGRHSGPNHGHHNRKAPALAKGHGQLA